MPYTSAYLRRNVRLAIALAALTLLAVTTAYAQTGQPTAPAAPCPTPCPPPPCGAGPLNYENKWHYSITPYLWLPGISGNVTVRSLTASVDASAGDIIDKLNWFTAFHIEAQRDAFGLYVDPLYVKLSAGGSVGNTSASVGFRQWLMEFAATVRLAGSNGTADTPSSSLLGILGGRYWNLQTSISAADGRSASRTRDWVDPIVGLRYRHGGIPWSFVLQGDIGGFGVGSEFTWSVAPILTYAVSESRDIVLGWRWLGVDYATGSGNDTFNVDVTYSGPILGYAFSF